MVDPSGLAPPASIVGRYAIHAEIAHGGMATVHLGRLTGPVGFSRTVAIKRLHQMFAKDPEFVAMFMDEARLAARIQHPNVVSIIDVVAEQGELLLVMDYIQGESLSQLLRAERQRGGRIDLRIVVKIMTEVLSGLHAAHEVTDERGVPLGVVHRDMSPQNTLVGVDGIAHLIDFGVAKAAGRIQSTREGQLKGKLPYMAPEQIRRGKVDRRTDLYAASAVLWELMVGRRLFQGDEATLVYGVLTTPIQAPSTLVPEVGPKLDAVVMKGLQRKPDKRFSTALEMADALEAALAPASSREVARWMQQLSAETLAQRAKLVAEVESMPQVSPPTSPLLGTAELPSELSASSRDSPVLVTVRTEPAKAIPPPMAASEALSTQTSSTISRARIMAWSHHSSLRWVGISAGVVIAGAGIWLLHNSFSASGVSPIADTSHSAPIKDDAAVGLGSVDAEPASAAASSPLPVSPDSGALLAATAAVAGSGKTTAPASSRPAAAVNTPSGAKKRPAYTRD